MSLDPHASLSQEKNPRFLDQLRRAMRLRHSPPGTEEAYVAWTRRFILYHGMRLPGQRLILGDFWSLEKREVWADLGAGLVLKMAGTPALRMYFSIQCSRVRVELVSDGRAVTAA